MGIPSFYRWLVDRYPRSVADVVEEAPVIEDDRPVPVDVSLPNPNGYEFDNLYLDMNGIIHPCFHPEGLPPPSAYDEVFQAVFMYIDKIFSIVRPRQLLYLAIDGVAPRAKMNQQRSRRFRSAKEMEGQASLKAERHESEENKFPVTGQSKMLDSNVITPGTEFMELLSSALRYYIHLRMNEEAGWEGIKVILSDASVPGEGEHKIMSYIRLQRNLPGFNPNTRHCLYGLDADLIMLALATHEIHFSVLREEVRKINSRDNVTKSGDIGSFMTQSGVSQQSPAFLDDLGHYISNLKFQFLNVWTLREYLMYDLRIPDSTSEVDLERLIDDFVFMCLLVGNDFLPHIPSLAISEGAIDLLMMLYKKEFVRMGGYLTDSFKINLPHVEHFIQAVGSYESEVFRKRIQMKKASGWGSNFGSQRRLDIKHLDWLGDNCNMSDAQDKGGRGVAGQRSVNGLGMDSAALVDKVKLGEDGWKERYYVHKFQLNSESECQITQRQVVTKYVEGLSWVMHYYYEGVCSWQWFYPFHYAPFASDFHGFANLEIKFTLGKPFKPFDQLMGVLPAASAHALPLSYGKLMKDDLSPIADFYPANFEVDMDGKRFSWQGICKLPFIDEARLLSEIAKVEHTLTDEEKRRNSLGWDILFVHKSNPLAVVIVSFSYKSSHLELLDLMAELEIDPKTSGGMNGYICIDQNPVWPMEICSPIDCWPAIANIGVITVFYKYPRSHPHIPNLPEGVILPDKSVSKKDILPPQLSLYDGTSFRMCTRKLMPNSVSGPDLSRLAHRLVLLHIAANTKGKRKLETTTETCRESQKDGEIASPGTGMVSGTINVIGKGGEITMGTQTGKKKKKKKTRSMEEEEKQSVAAAGQPQPGQSSLPSVCTINSKRGMGKNAGKVESGDLSRVGKSDSCNNVRILEEMSDALVDVNNKVLDVDVLPGIISGRKRCQVPERECPDAAGTAVEAVEPTSRKRKGIQGGSRKKTVCSEETSNSFGKLEESSVIMREDKKAVVEKQLEKCSADVDISERCSSAFTLNKSGAGIVGATPRESDRVHVVADRVTEAVEEITGKKKKRRQRKKMIVEVSTNEKTVCSKETNNSFGELEKSSVIMREDNEEAVVEKQLEKCSADDISERCSSAFTLNKSGAVGATPRESDGVHVVADRVTEAVEEITGKKRKRRQRKKKIVEVGIDEKTVCSEETNTGFGELGERSVIMKEDKKEAVVEKQLEKGSADVDISERCSSAFTLNKSGAVGAMPRESDGTHVVADRVTEAVEEITGKKRKRRQRKKRIVEVGTNEKPVCIEVPNNSFEELDESSVTMREDKKEAVVEKQLEKSSADVDISERCSHAFTLNKSGAGTVGAKQSESDGIHVVAERVMEAVEEIIVKKRTAEENRNVEVDTNKNTTGI